MLKASGIFFAPDRVFELGLTSDEGYVLLYLCRRAGPDQSSWPSIRLIADQCRLSIRQVQYCLSALTKAGVLTRTARQRENGSLTSNLYQLTFSVLIEGGVVQDMHQDGAQPAPLEGIAVEGTEREIVKSTISRSAAGDAGFAPPSPNPVTDLVDRYRLIAGIDPTPRDGGVIASLVKKFGAVRVRAAIEVAEPQLIASDRPLHYLAAVCEGRRGAFPAGGQSLQERMQATVEMLEREQRAGRLPPEPRARGGRVT